MPPRRDTSEQKRIDDAQATGQPDSTRHRDANMGAIDWRMRRE
jgi:hypothetical protein